MDTNVGVKLPQKYAENQYQRQICQEQSINAPPPINISYCHPQTDENKYQRYWQNFSQRVVQKMKILLSDLVQTKISKGNIITGNGKKVITIKDVQPKICMGKRQKVNKTHCLLYGIKETIFKWCKLSQDLIYFTFLQSSGDFV